MLVRTMKRHQIIGMHVRPARSRYRWKNKEKSMGGSWQGRENRNYLFTCEV